MFASIFSPASNSNAEADNIIHSEERITMLGMSSSPSAAIWCPVSEFSLFP